VILDKDDGRVYFLVKEVAEIFGKSTQWVRNMESPKLKFKRKDFSQTRLISVTDIENMAYDLHQQGKLKSLDHILSQVERFDR
jgi:hypothetical protein